MKHGSQLAAAEKVTIWVACIAAVLATTFNLSSADPTSCSPFAGSTTTVTLGGHSFQRVKTTNLTSAFTLMHVSCVSMSYDVMFLADDLSPDFTLTLMAETADKRRTSLALFSQSYNANNFTVSRTPDTRITQSHHASSFWTSIARLSTQVK